MREYFSRGTYRVGKKENRLQKVFKRENSTYMLQLKAIGEMGNTEGCRRQGKMEGWKTLQEVGKRKDELKRYGNFGIVKIFLLEEIGCRKYRKVVCYDS